ncbi:hypothetical protein PC129_g3338 [Phytophthora cactorum]|uniref:PX domain-containing protein n=1 Tax=Phytophthora cactorum TaxID=29920 RepID=A0A329T032_9STRA|nr:hypothetical protein Pcac1_g23769 [Phytophthora cactorum]KAG2833143.1 hypothetical protein PC112_g6620 [Phytophthora cactorum]KAG2835571.1 hypothetical protein PC111_g5372 [Phytophthora cactorum]KAG2866466.1 hypothetical protein PC113_g2820 [Phytophthora cactorum]KAG2917628.1 hypothetical protein PC114_g7044 [Phytophthora cactorum]
MSTEEIHATSFSVKNEMTGRPEADEDARTESSEGSNSQSHWTTDAVDSEDEFVDAVEPPSSTSGVQLTFEGAAPPLSGVYEDAVEATDEQILAALTRSEGSGGRQLPIQEDEEEENMNEKVDATGTEVDDEIEAIVEEIVASTEAAEEDAAEENAANEEIEQVAEVNAAAVVAENIDDQTVIEETVAGDQESSVGKVTDDAEVQKTTETDEVDGKAIEISAVIAREDAPQEIAAAEPVNNAVGTSNEHDTSDEINDTISLPDPTEDTVVETPAEPELKVDADAEVEHCDEYAGGVNEVTGVAVQDNDSPEVEAPPEDTTAEQAATDASDNDAAQGNDEAAVESVDEVTPAVADEEEVAEETILKATEVDALIEAEDDGTKEATAEETMASKTESTEEEQPDAAGAANHEEIVAVGCDETSAKQEEATQPAAEDANQDVAGQQATVSEVEEVVAHVTDELVEAVQLVQQTLDEKAALESVDIPVNKSENPADKHRETVDNADAVVVEPDDGVAPAAASAPASAVKEVCNEDNEHVVVDFMPRFGPSSGMTTTTTIEPFVLSSDSNEMIEAHFPPQRWTYEVYGFSIRDRVVYYHIHRSDHRAGIREPPALKRYTDFRELQLQLLDTRLHASVDMPRIPRPHLGTVFRGYKSKKTIEMRESAFRALLRYISQYPELHGSAVFERFITTSRAATGAGWM